MDTIRVNSQNIKKVWQAESYKEYNALQWYKIGENGFENKDSLLS